MSAQERLLSRFSHSSIGRDELVDKSPIWHLRCSSRHKSQKNSKNFSSHMVSHQLSSSEASKQRKKKISNQLSRQEKFPLLSVHMHSYKRMFTTKISPMLSSMNSTVLASNNEKNSRNMCLTLFIDRRSLIVHQKQKPSTINHQPSTPSQESSPTSS